MFCQLLRWTVILGCLAQSTATLADPPPSVGRVVEALAAPGDPARQFVQSYAEKVADRIGNLDEFANAVAGERPQICNIVCQACAAPAYFKSKDRQSWVELIRYVFTSTCYGVAPEFRRDALDDIEGVLSLMGNYDPQKLFPGGASIEGEVVVHVLERAVKLNAADNQYGSDGKRYPAILRLAEASGYKRNADTYVVSDKAKDGALADACKASRYSKAKARKT